MKKKILLVVMIVLMGTFGHVKQAHAFPLFEIIRQAIIKAVKAADLAIQREQNKVIWLQNAQKVLENTMSKLKLDEISNWTEKQKEQYRKYYDELWRVKAMISYYKRIREVTQKQVMLVKEFERTWKLLKSDKHFKPEEIIYMGKVYAGMLAETIKNVDQMMLIVNSFKTQMSDAKRLELINAAADRVDTNYDDLRQFNKENAMLSLSRSKSDHDRAFVKRLYGIK
ncbi:conjugal transfer protein TraI [Pedobacter insulae]|uniref:Conjugal transfer protein TraI n=1 Tax=Pedobacter insulae TaxID=414048 RepID=A0A1I2ZJS7_9SPHI|nr:conjugal transfer protein TraI [Pedobacter insulae]SFH37915.1 hypothetical protein SAMN04489864_11074 [Pedobacter insulae]